jgi:multidrug resistance protein, MATE family
MVLAAPLAPVAAPFALTHRRVLALALPMTLAHLSEPLLGLTDTVVVGRLGQADLLAGLAAATVVFDLLFWAFGFLRLGTGGLAAQAVGAGDLVEQKAVYLRAIGVAVGAGILLILLQVPIRWLAFSLMGASPAATAAAETYFNIRIWSAPFALMSYAILGWLIGRGRTDIGFILQVGLNLVNIAFTITAVFGLSLSVAGAALGTLLAEIVGCAAGLVIVGRFLRGTAQVPRARLLDAARIRQTLLVNRDLMIRSISLVLAFTFFQAQGARAGDTVLAANAVLMHLFLLGSYFLDGFATAAEQMCGTAFGARDRSGFRRAVRLTALWCLGFGLAVSLLWLAAGHWLIRFMTTNEDVRATAMHYLRLAALTPLAGALAFEFDGVYAGSTWTAAMRDLMLLSLALFLVVWWLTVPLGNVGLWLSLLTFLLARGLLQLVRFPPLERASFA